MPFLSPQNRISLAIPSKALDFLENCIGLFQEVAEIRVDKKIHDLFRNPMGKE